MTKSKNKKGKKFGSDQALLPLLSSGRADGHRKSRDRTSASGEQLVVKSSSPKAGSVVAENTKVNLKLGPKLKGKKK